MKDIRILLLVTCSCHIVSTQSDVRLPPTMKSPRSDQLIYRKHENVTLECIAEGTPAVRYEWKKNGFKLNTTLSNNIHKGSDGTITISAATERDDGYYQCFGGNQYGTALSDVTDVRMAFLDSSTGQSTVLQKRTAVEGMPFHMEAHPPRAFPSSFPNIVTGWIKSVTIDAGHTILLFSKRIQFTMNGDIHFAYVLPEDAVGGRIYRSLSYSLFLKQEVLGSPIQLTVSKNPAGNLSHFAPTLAFASETENVVLIGHIAIFRCFFYGYPEPTILWAGMKTARYYTGAYKKDVNDTTLILERIIASDEGTYKCLGKNIRGNSTHTFQLRVEDVPKFRNTKDGPCNVNVTEGESVTFNCNATAIPEANITWLQNGWPIDTANPPERFMFSDNLRSLTIRDVCRDCVDRESKTDLMVIQCNASNVHGYAFAQGYLNVLKKTVVTIRGSRNVSVDFTKETQFVFQCFATSDPSTASTVRWYKTEPFDELVRDEPPYVDVKTQTLLIRFNGNCSANCVNYLGEYRCVGDNRYSSGNSTITISYHYRPPIGAVMQEEETWALWKIFLGAAAICLVLFLIGIFLGFRSKRCGHLSIYLSMHDASSQMKNRRSSNLPGFYDDIGYDSVGFPLEELAGNTEESITRKLNEYEQLGYDSIVPAATLSGEAFPQLPDAQEENKYELIDDLP